MPSVADPVVSISYWLGFVVVFAWVLSLMGLVFVLAARGKGPPRSREPLILPLALTFAILSGVLVYGVVQYYTNQSVAQDTWRFNYRFTVEGNATTPDAVVLPAVRDESLLRGLRLTSGFANWSFVDTPKGRGLYVRFTSSATLEVSVSLHPRPSVLPDTTVTLADTANGTSWPNARIWAYYAGVAGGHLSLSIQNSYTTGYLVPGWFAYPLNPLAVP